MSRMIEKIELTLLDLSKCNSHDDDDDNHHEKQRRQTTKTSVAFVTQVKEILDTLSCCNAVAWLQQQQQQRQPNDNNDTNTTTDGEATKAKLRQDILRYVMQRDAHLALASILLKSRAFYQIYEDIVDDDDTISPQCTTRQQQGRRPLMDLPRTQHNKPFIPIFRRDDGCDQKQDQSASINAVQQQISLSHQFPFCGLVRFVPKQQQQQQENNQHDDNDDDGNGNHSRLLLLGFDIVCFDIVPRNKDLLQDNVISSFVDCFCSNFTPAEWDIIQSAAASTTDKQQQCNGDEMMLREFCIRWAVKETYTKALGVGLGFDFASFQMIFELNKDLETDDNKDDHDKTKTTTTKNSNPFLLYKWLLDNANNNNNNNSNQRQHQHHQQTLVGTVVLVTSPVTMKKQSDSDDLAMMRPTREEWMFSFQLLYKKQQQQDCNISGNHGGEVEATTIVPFGCACTAWGPLSPRPSDGGSDKDTMTRTTSAATTIRVENQWTSLDELVAWHVNA